MLKQEITVWAALTIGSASVYHLIRGNVEKAAYAEKPLADQYHVAHRVPERDPSGKRPRQAHSRYDPVFVALGESTAARLGLSRLRPGGCGYSPAHEEATRESVDAPTARGQPRDGEATGAHRTCQ